MTIAIATEMRLRWLRPKQHCRKFHFRSFSDLFSGVLNNKLKKIMFFYLKFSLESGNTFFLIFSNTFFDFLQNLILLKSSKKSTSFYEVKLFLLDFFYALLSEI